MAGVMASFAGLGDIIMAEPKALYRLYRAAGHRADHQAEIACWLSAFGVSAGTRPDRHDSPPQKYEGDLSGRLIDYLS